MKPETFIQALIATLPSHEVRGKKRLQKFGYILKLAGVPLDANFFLYDYGPFSVDMARAAEILSLVGMIKEDDRQIGTSGTFMTVYSLSKDTEMEPFEKKYSDLVIKIDHFQTVDLEIAATIMLFESEGKTREKARELTKSMKPLKTTANVVANAEKVIKILHAQR